MWVHVCIVRLCVLRLGDCVFVLFFYFPLYFDLPSWWINALKECNISRNTRFETLLIKIGPAVWPLAALMNKQTKKHRPLTFHPFVGVTTLNWSTRHLGTEWRPQRNHHAKFCVNWLRGFSVAAPPKVPFPILFWTTLKTVLHYRADCDLDLSMLSVTAPSLPLVSPHVVFLRVLFLVLFYSSCTLPTLQFNMRYKIKSKSRTSWPAIKFRSDIS